MRVLFVSQEFPPETAWGGIGTYVANISRVLSARGLDVHVLSVATGQPPTTSQADGVTVHRFPLPGHDRPQHRLPEAWSRLWLSVTVSRLLDTFRPMPSLIECPDWKAEGFALALRGKFPLAVRLHSTARQLFPYSGQGRQLLGLDGRLAFWLEEATVRRANVVLSPRGNFADVAGWMGLDERAAHLIPPVVPLPEQVPYPESSASPRVTFVGRLEPRKAPDVVLTAMPGVLAAAPDTKFVFVGRDIGDEAAPSSSASLRREAERLGVADALELRGQLGWDGVLEELRRARVCVFPSRWECFPNVAAEAAAIGRPLVVSSITGFQELVQDGVTGRVLSSDEPRAWSAAIAELLLDRDRGRTFGEAGAALVRRVADPAKLADRTIVAYEDAINRWRRGQRAGRELKARRTGFHAPSR